jgi:hypothetical protein
MATLKVNLTIVGNASIQENTPANLFPMNGWYLFLLKPDCSDFSKPMNNRSYGMIPVDRGYAEIKDVPPGRYLLYAIQNPFEIAAFEGGGLFQSNYISQYAVVDVCCGCKDVCVTLYNTGLHHCIIIIVHWLNLLAAQKYVDPKIAQTAIKALTDVVKATGKTSPGDEILNAHIEKITKLFIKSNETKKDKK